MPRLSSAPEGQVLRVLTIRSRSQVLSAAWLHGVSR